MSRLRDERVRRGWSLTRLTCLTGIDTASLSRLERRQMAAYPGWRKRIADAFGMPEESLFEEAMNREHERHAENSPQG